MKEYEIEAETIEDARELREKRLYIKLAVKPQKGL